MRNTMTICTKIASRIAHYKKSHLRVRFFYSKDDDVKSNFFRRQLLWVEDLRTWPQN